MPHVDESHVAAVHVAATRYDDHAGPVRIRRFLEPLQVWNPVLVGIEAFPAGLVGHRGDLVPLRVRHLAFRPNGDALLRAQGQGQQEKKEGRCFFHGLIDLNQ